MQYSGEQGGNNPDIDPSAARCPDTRLTAATAAAASASADSTNHEDNSSTFARLTQTAKKRPKHSATAALPLEKTRAKRLASITRKSEIAIRQYAKKEQTGRHQKAGAAKNRHLGYRHNKKLA